MSTSQSSTSGEMAKDKEQEILDQLAVFADQVVATVEKLPGVVKLFAADRYDDLAEVVRELGRLESQADDTKEAILDRLATGSVFPMARADLARLVGSVDGIANLGMGVGDRLLMRRISLPREINKLLLAMAEVDLEAVRLLRDAVLAMRTDLRETIRRADMIDKVESRVDDLYAETYRHMFDMDVDFRTFHQLKAIIDRLESIADRCSQNAELLRHMALEYLESQL